MAVLSLNQVPQAIAMIDEAAVKICDANLSEYLADKEMAAVIDKIERGEFCES